MNNIIIKEDIRIDLAEIDKMVTFVVKQNEERNLFLTNFQDDNEISIEIEEGGYLHLSILADKKINKAKMMANLDLNSQISVYFADFSEEVNRFEAVINLNKEGATVNWKTASLASKKDKKEIVVSIYHNAPKTYAQVDNYGVTKDESKLLFAGTSHILNGSIKSKTQQNAKIMVFDDKCDAIAKPILKIDENDIEASHAAAVGKISDEHIFYLTSRGVSLEEAKMLITLGYLKPIFKGFNDSDIDYMNKIMEGRL